MQRRRNERRKKRKRKNPKKSKRRKTRGKRLRQRKKRNERNKMHWNAEFHRDVRNLLLSDRPLLWSAKTVKNTTSYSEATTLMEQIEEERQVTGVCRSPRTLASKPAPLTKMRGKRAATTPSVATKNTSVRPMGLPPETDVPRLGKAARAIGVRVAQRMTAAEEGFLESCLASCYRHLANVEKNITRNDRESLEDYVRETKVRMVRSHRRRTPGEVTRRLFVRWLAWLLGRPMWPLYRLQSYRHRQRRQPQSRGEQETCAM